MQTNVPRVVFGTIRTCNDTNDSGILGDDWAIILNKTQQKTEDTVKNDNKLRKFLIRGGKNLEILKL